MSAAVSQSKSEPRSFLLKSLGLTLLLLPILLAATHGALFEGSDYLMTFYIAGKMVLYGHASDLYPSAGATSFFNTRLNALAHATLPHLPTTHISIFMYDPLIAVIFAPYALLSSQASLIAWQCTSIAAFLICTLLLARSTKQRYLDALKHGVFYLPVTNTLLLGHISITLGLLPLAAGIAFYLRQRFFWAGLVWSLLVLKPQFLPMVLLAIGACALKKEWRLAGGFVLGTALLVILTVFCLSPAVFMEWFSALKLSDTIFSDSRYAYPTYLVSSLPAELLQLSPMASRNLAKIPAYFLAMVIGVHALWLCATTLNPKSAQYGKQLLLTLIIGIGVLPLVVPHFLFYDLCIFALFGIMVHSKEWNQEELAMLLSNHWLYLTSINVYMFLFMSAYRDWLAQPVVLVIILAFLYTRLVRIAQRARAADISAQEELLESPH